jgi:general secretion pathway protein G
MSRDKHMALRRRPGRLSHGPRPGVARGFTLFELAVVAIVTSLLAVVLLQRLWSYQEVAEQAAMRSVLSSLSLGLRAQTLSLYTQGREADVAALAEQNPMQWLAAKPANYRGEFSAPSLEEIDGNSWFFDKSNKKLAYLLRERKFFDRNRSTPTYFHVELIRLPTSPARPSGTPETIEGVALNQVKE